MPNKIDWSRAIEVWVMGIPALAEVHEFQQEERCYFRLSYQLFDRRGYRADWLEDKLDNNPKARDKFEEDLIDKLQRLAREAWDRWLEEQAEDRRII